MGDILAKSQDGLDGNVHNHHPLGTEMERKNLEGIGNQQPRKANVIKDSKQPDETKLGVTPQHAGLIAAFVKRPRDSPACHRHDHPAGRDQEQRSSAKAVDIQSGGNGDDKVEGNLASRHGKLLPLGIIGDTGTLVDDIHVVGEQSIPAVLGDDTQRNDNGQTPPVAPCAHKVDILGCPVCFLLDANGLLDLAVLKLDRRIVDIAAGVPFCQRPQCLLMAILVDEISRRLRDEPYATKLDE